MSKYTDYNSSLIKALLHIDRITVSEIFVELLHDHVAVEQIELLLVETLEKIGSMWEEDSISLAQVYMSAVICEENIDMLNENAPDLAIKQNNMPVIAIAVLIDHHTLGKSIVSSIMKTAGFDLLDMGYGLTPDELAYKAIQNNVEILLISTLMLPSALKIREVRKKLDFYGKKIKIVSGGAPFRFDSKLWRKVGADADGGTASDTIRVVKGMIQDEKN